MATLKYFVDGVNGRYGIRGALASGETFGSWGAAVCVIVLVKLPEGKLFCGHMACEYSGGVAANEAIVKTKVAALLTLAVKDANKGCSWAMTYGSNERTNTWMQTAIRAWFTHGPDPSATNKTDGYFSGSGATITLDNTITGGTTEVNTGDFTVKP